MKVTLPAQFIKPVFKADRSVRLEFETRELLGSEVAILTDMRQSEGWLLFAPTELSTNDLPEEKANAGLGTKTPSQRLRSVLFVFWEQSGKKGSFEDYYRTQVEKLIDYIKEKLE